MHVEIVRNIFVIICLQCITESIRPEVRNSWINVSRKQTTPIYKFKMPLIRWIRMDYECPKLCQWLPILPFCKLVQVLQTWFAANKVYIYINNITTTIYCYSWHSEWHSLVTTRGRLNYFFWIKAKYWTLHMCAVARCRENVVWQSLLWHSIATNLTSQEYWLERVYIPWPATLADNSVKPSAVNLHKHGFQCTQKPGYFLQYFWRLQYRKLTNVFNVLRKQTGQSTLYAIFCWFIICNNLHPCSRFW